MIENLKLYYQTHGTEICVATLEVEVNGQTIIRTLDFSGNNISGALFGAVSVINSLQELLGKEPEGFVCTKGKR